MFLATMGARALVAVVLRWWLRRTARSLEAEAGEVLEGLEDAHAWPELGAVKAEVIESSSSRPGRD
jgi:hypothetical protein